MKIFKLILAIAFVSAFTGCANDDDYSTPDLSGECVSLTATKQVADIVALSTDTKQQYTADDIIEAYVTSSDEGGNFYKSVSFVSLDGTKTFSMPIDAYNIFNKFEPGRKVYVHLKDLYYQTDFDATIIGQLYNNNTPDDLTDDEVGRISGIEYATIIERSCDKISEEDLVIKNLTIQQAMHDENLNKLIEFDSVQFTDPSLGKKLFDASLNNLGSATNHEIVDKYGKKVILRVSMYATYSGNAVPSGNGKIRGVLTKFGNDYQFMTRTMRDIQLNDPRNVAPPIPPPGGGPSADAVLAFPGSDFETWADFTNGINSFGLKPYATQAVGGGRIGGNALHIGNTGATNDYVFTSFARAGAPAAPTKLHFYIKGTSTKTISLNIYKANGTSYTVYNLEDVTGPKTLDPATANQYTGTINTGGVWTLITVDLSTLTDINTTGTAINFFALKVGKEATYDIYLDDFTIE